MENKEPKSETEETAESEIKETADKKVHARFTLWQKIRLAWNIISLAFYCFYCGYFIRNGLGSKIVNYILLGTTIAYFAVFVIIWIVKGRKGNRFRGASKRVYKLTRKLTLLINTIITGGAIINMSARHGRMIVSVCASILIGNLVLNILWLLLMHYLEKRYEKQIYSIKSDARKFASGLKSLFKKGFMKEEELSDNSDLPKSDVDDNIEDASIRNDHE